MNDQKYKYHARGEAAELITIQEYSDNMKLNPKMTLLLTNQVYQYYGTKAQLILVMTFVNTLIRTAETGLPNE